MSWNLCGLMRPISLWILIFQFHSLLNRGDVQEDVPTALFLSPPSSLLVNKRSFFMVVKKTSREGYATETYSGWRTSNFFIRFSASWVALRNKLAVMTTLAARTFAATFSSTSSSSSASSTVNGKVALSLLIQTRIKSQSTNQSILQSIHHLLLVNLACQHWWGVSFKG